ncbi:hypothetical protein BTVI_70390 [Pitangus sulphuratus]|nr:hypothetical protein BTVI_70390 [Pitangus sulphuratus]
MADELYLENIDEFVTDQNRVAASLWMAVSLPRMLYDYVERKRKENSGAQLHVTYLVAGDLRQNGHVVSTASSKPPTKNNIINNFFGKAAMNKLKVSPMPEQPKEEKEVVKPSVAVAEQESSPNPIVEKPGKRTESVRIQQKDRKSKMKRVDRSDNEEERDPENTKRKRKRIKQLESDSSDEEDVPPPPTPEEEKAPSPPHIPALKTELEPAAMEVSAGGRKRKRKRVLKSKMFIDEEEGCMVTEKVYESESCTDSEEEFPKPKPPAAHKQPVLPMKKELKEERKTLKKGAAPANRANKQVSIMGFFQKK